MPQHLFDPRTQLDYIVWHKDPNLESFIRHLITTLKPDRWVETGTHMGWTSMWIAQNFPDLPIYTVEVDETFHAMARDNLAPYPQVALSLGHSPDFLRDLKPITSRGLTVFWLDAHWWPPVPLKDECRIVASHERFVCLIDDFSCWNPDFSGDTFYTIAPSSGDAHLNDISYVAAEMGERYWRPNYAPAPGYKGVGLFTRGTSYVPPWNLMKKEDLDEFIATRPVGRPDSYPLHPSCGRKEP